MWKHRLFLPSSLLLLSPVTSFAFRLQGKGLCSSVVQMSTGSSSTSSSISRNYQIATKPNGSKREVITADANIWLTESHEPLGGSVFTSMPDPMSKARAYEEWFTDAAYHIMCRLRPGQDYAIFLQSPVRLIEQNTNNVLHWIDKGKLCSIAADRAGCTMMWHKMTLNSSIDKLSIHRPGYSDLVCYGKETKYNAAAFAVPDIIERGQMIWPKAIGLDATILGVSFLKHCAGASQIIDPFCGFGTVLAVANYYEIDALGVEISAKRSARALRRTVAEDIECIPVGRRKLLGVREPIVYRPRRTQPNYPWIEKISKDEEETRYWFNVVTKESSFSFPLEATQERLGGDGDAKRTEPGDG